MRYICQYSKRRVAICQFIIMLFPYRYCHLPHHRCYQNQQIILLLHCRYIQLTVLTFLKHQLCVILRKSTRKRLTMLRTTLEFLVSNMFWARTFPSHEGMQQNIEGFNILQNFTTRNFFQRILCTIHEQMRTGSS